MQGAQLDGWDCSGKGHAPNTVRCIPWIGYISSSLMCPLFSFPIHTQLPNEALHNKLLSILNSPSLLKLHYLMCSSRRNQWTESIEKVPFVWGYQNEIFKKVRANEHCDHYWIIILHKNGVDELLFPNTTAHVDQISSHKSLHPSTQHSRQGLP